MVKCDKIDTREKKPDSIKTNELLDRQQNLT